MMNRSIGSSVLCIGAAAALALAGCAHHEPPAKQATSSPTFESNVGTSPTSEQGQPSTQGPTQPAAPAGSAPGGAAGAYPGAAQPSTEQPGQGAQAPSAPAPAVTISEMELCTSLSRDATMHVEDVPGGAAINIKPHSSADLPAVRKRAQQVQQRLEQSGGGAPSGAACELFTIVRAGATTAVTETPDSVRILVTTPDEKRVRTIRKQARDFVESTEKSHEGSHR